jgi:hypothetical protein
MPRSWLDHRRDETALRLEAGARYADVQNELIDSAPGQLEAFIRDEFARRRRAESTRAPATRVRHQQTEEGGRPRQPAGLRAGAPGLADAGREQRAAASTRLAAVPRASRESAGTTVLRCGACGLVIGLRTAAIAPRYCPRCLARRRALVPLGPFGTVRQ